MSKPQNKGQVEMLTGKLEAAQVGIKRLESDVAKLQRRLAAKAQEVADAKQARKEALILLREAASHDPELAQKAIALLAADAMTEQQVAALAAADAAVPAETF